MRTHKTCFTKVKIFSLVFTCMMLFCVTVYPTMLVKKLQGKMLLCISTLARIELECVSHFV